MNSRVLIFAIFALALNGPSAISAASRVSRPASKTVIIYTGTVDSRSAKRFTALIARNADKVIGLKLSIERSRDSDLEFSSSRSGNQLNITSGNPMDAPVEVIINESVGLTGAGAYFTVDGFYLVKSGGSHAAGALSYGAMPVNEATLRLNPKIRLVTRPF